MYIYYYFYNSTTLRYYPVKITDISLHTFFHSPHETKGSLSSSPHQIFNPLTQVLYYNSNNYNDTHIGEYYERGEVDSSCW